ncbi:MAG TPA: glycosyltransferase [Anaerolineales bacterium]|nr:glycosyltransferase [Anaerolineales bacterium]
MPEPRRIVVLFSDTGGGHRSAGEAIAEAVELEFPSRFQVELVDVFKKYAPTPLNQTPALYPEIMRRPQTWGLAYRLSNGHQRGRVLTAISWPYVRRAAQRLVSEVTADVFVAVHPLFIAPVLKALGPRRPPFVAVVTDLVSTHALWYHHQEDQCCVPTQIAFDRAIAFGMRPEQVQLVGLPVAHRFCVPQGERDALCRELGWPVDRPTVLVVGGGEGMGPLFETARAIAQGGGRFALAVIAGRNENLRRRMEAAAWDVPTTIYGFERRMPEMMRAARFLVTKAGPGTIAEALNAGLPMVLYSYLPGQEEGNAGYVVDIGAGIWAPGPEATAAAVRAWLARPEEVARAAQAAQAAARPDAGRAVARLLAAYAERRMTAPSASLAAGASPVA